MNKACRVGDLGAPMPDLGGGITGVETAGAIKTFGVP